jgi:hypothetical protein
LHSFFYGSASTHDFKFQPPTPSPTDPRQQFQFNVEISIGGTACLVECNDFVVSANDSHTHMGANTGLDLVWVVAQISNVWNRVWKPSSRLEVADLAGLKDASGTLVPLHTSLRVCECVCTCATLALVASSSQPKSLGGIRTWWFQAVFNKTSGKPLAGPTTNSQRQISLSSANEHAELTVIVGRRQRQDQDQGQHTQKDQDLQQYLRGLSLGVSQAQLAGSQKVISADHQQQQQQQQHNKERKKTPSVFTQPTPGTQSTLIPIDACVMPGGFVFVQACECECASEHEQLHHGIAWCGTHVHIFAFACGIPCLVGRLLGWSLAFPIPGCL